MAEHILASIVLVIALGIGAQWFAWRIRVPSILLLLVFGFLAGPVTGVLSPETLQGDWILAFVSVSIGIILFEGGLSLRISELREGGKAVVSLITVGVLVTWILASVAAYYVLGMNIAMAVLLGAILTVTGPTVVIPLLRQVRPKGRVGAIAKWEGITIDPVGAILAVLVLEAIIEVHSLELAEFASVGAAVVHALKALLMTICVGVGVGTLAAVIIVFVLRRRLVPDYLQNSVVLMIVVATYGLSNSLQGESGLLQATLLGILLANQKYVTIRHIMKFKEDLQVLLLACLFILLSARLDLEVVEYFDGRAFLFLGILILLVRPVSVFLATMTTNLNLKEKTLLAWLAPRGIVAAAVASLFAFRLAPVYPVQAERLVPIVFFVIVGTVAAYGLTLSPVARRLGLADPYPQGILFLGAYPWVQRMAKAVHNLGFKVQLMDANAENIADAEALGLPAVTANALSETVFDELDFSGLGRFAALTPNDNTNSLAALHFAEVFEEREVYQLAAGPGSRAAGESNRLGHLRGRPLFGESTTQTSLSNRFNKGGEIRTFHLAEEGAYEAIMARFDDDLILLFIVRGSTLLVHAEEGGVTPLVGDSLIVMLPEFSLDHDRKDPEELREMVSNAVILDIEEEVAGEEIAARVSAMIAQYLPVDADIIRAGLHESMQQGASLIAPGVALPQLRVATLNKSELGLVRVSRGLPGARDDHEDSQARGARIYAFIFLLSPSSDSDVHTHAHSYIAGRLGDSSFIEEWRSAESIDDLRLALGPPEQGTGHADDAFSSDGRREERSRRNRRLSISTKTENAIAK